MGCHVRLSGSISRSLSVFSYHRGKRNPGHTSAIETRANSLSLKFQRPSQFGSAERSTLAIRASMNAERCCSKRTANSLGRWSLHGHILRLRRHCKYEMPARLAPQFASQLRKVASVWLRQSCRGSFAMAGSAYTPSTPWADEAAESSKSRMSTQASASMAPRADWSVCCNRSDTRAPTRR